MPTEAEINAVLAELGKQHHECLCYVPMRTVVNAAGLSCNLCGLKVTDFYYSDEAKTLRGEALIAAFPELRRQSEPDEP